MTNQQPYNGLSKPSDVIINSTRFVLECRDLIEDIKNGTPIEPPRHMGTLAFDLAHWCDAQFIGFDPSPFLELSNQIRARHTEQERGEQPDDWRPIEEMLATLSCATNTKDRLCHLIEPCAHLDSALNSMAAALKHLSRTAEAIKRCSRDNEFFFDDEGRYHNCRNRQTEIVIGHDRPNVGQTTVLLSLVEKHAGELRDSHEGAERTLGNFRSAQLRGLNNLAGGEWLPKFRFHLLNRILVWPGHRGPHTALGTQNVPERESFYEFVKSSDPTETWSGLLHDIECYRQHLAAVVPVHQVHSEAHRSDDESEPPKPPAENIFKMENDTWTVQFQGGDVQRGIKNSKALSDIAYLIRHRSKKIDILDLPNNREAKSDTPSTYVANEEDLKRLLKQIVERQQKLENETDHLVQQELQKEIEALRKQKNENFDKFGRPRVLAGDTQKTIEATQKRVNYFIKKLSPILPDLADHFVRRLKIGRQCSYETDAIIIWELSPED